MSEVTVFGLAALPLALAIDRVANGVTRPMFGWISDLIGREKTMLIAFGMEAVAMTLWLMLRHDPVMFVVLSGQSSGGRWPRCSTSIRADGMRCSARLSHWIAARLCWRSPHSSRCAARGLRASPGGHSQNVLESRPEKVAANDRRSIEIYGANTPLDRTLNVWVARALFATYK